MAVFGNALSGICDVRVVFGCETVCMRVVPTPAAVPSPAPTAVEAEAEVEVNVEVYEEVKGVYASEVEYMGVSSFAMPTLPVETRKGAGAGTRAKKEVEGRVAEETEAEVEVEVEMETDVEEEAVDGGRDV